MTRSTNHGLVNSVFHPHPGPLPFKGEGIPIVCFGDSITHGYGVESEQSFPAILGRLLKLTVINSGVNGDTILGAGARVEMDVLQHKPGLVTVELGANDYLSGISAEQAGAELSHIVRIIRDAGPEVIVLSLGSEFWGDEYENALKEVAEAQSARFMTGLLTGIAGDSLLTLDDVHPNVTGYIVIARRVADFIRGVVQWPGDQVAE
jgi:acyl-CoA thioesterase-1